MSIHDLPPHALAALLRMNTVLATTTIVAAPSLSPAQIAERRALILVPEGPERCPVCNDPDGVRCCEFGSS